MPIRDRFTEPNALEATVVRAEAIKRLEAITAFRRAHLAAYVLVSCLLVVVWALLTPSWFFWPIVPILLWGSGQRGGAEERDQRAGTSAGRGAGPRGAPPAGRSPGRLRRR
jgi:hypothetical protein